MSDNLLAVIRKAEAMFERLKLNRHYRPSVQEFEDIISKCPPKNILKFLKRGNSLGTVMHSSIVGHGYTDLVRCALYAIKKEDVLSLLMVTSDTSETGEMRS